MNTNLQNSLDFVLKDYNYATQAFLVILLAMLTRYLLKKVLAQFLKKAEKTKILLINYI